METNEISRETTDYRLELKTTWNMVDDDSPKHPLPQGIKHLETQELACLATQ